MRATRDLIRRRLHLVRVQPNWVLNGRRSHLFDVSLYLVLLYDELMPEGDLLAGIQFGDLVVDEFLDYLNAKIAKRRAQNADWHAVFFVHDEPISEVEEFARRIKYEVIPLFQEHCYED